MFIRLYENVQNHDTCYNEIVHKYLLKKNFFRTNKNKNYEIQILKHNRRRTNMIVMIDLLIFKKINVNSLQKKKFESNVTQSIKFKKIECRL